MYHRPNPDPEPDPGGGRIEGNTQVLDSMHANTNPGGGINHSVQKWAQLLSQESTFQAFLPDAHTANPQFGRHTMEMLDQYQFTTAFCEMGEVGLENDEFMNDLFNGSLPPMSGMGGSNAPPHLGNNPQGAVARQVDVSRRNAKQEEAQPVGVVVQEPVQTPQAQIAIHASTSARISEQMESKPFDRIVDLRAQAQWREEGRGNGGTSTSTENAKVTNLDDLMACYQWPVDANQIQTAKVQTGPPSSGGSISDEDDTISGLIEQLPAWFYAPAQSQVRTEETPSDAGQPHPSLAHSEIPATDINASNSDKMTRAAKVERYKQKRSMRQFNKTVRYEARKQNAERRPRVKGRFVKQSKPETEVSEGTAVHLIEVNN